MSSNAFTRAIRTLWEKKDTQSQGETLPSYNIQAQIDDVFLVLALMGEALLPLEVFDDTHYDSTLNEVRFAMSNCGNVVLEDLFDKMSAELKYLSVAALTVCAVFSPLHVYRGFGASVHGDWDWASPDFEYLEGKAKKSTGIFSKTPDPQPNRPVLLAFDRAIQLLQMKTLAFLSRRPTVSGLLEHQPRYAPRSRNDLLGEFHTCRDWKRYIHKNGHPAPQGMAITTWSMPWAGWTSSFNCEMTRDFEQILTNQMDPGRILHAFLCKDMLSLQVGHLLALPPGSPAEVLACWLADCPGMLHKIVTWDQIETAKDGRLRHLDKKVMKKMGRYPLPNRFAVHNAKAASLPRPPVRNIPSFAATTHTELTLPSSAPPVYTSLPSEELHELGTSDPVELDSTPSDQQRSRQLPALQSTFVTRPKEMPLSVASLQRELPPVPCGDTESHEQIPTLLKNNPPNHETSVEMPDTSTIPAPLRLRNPKSFGAELPAEPVELTFSRSATLASTVSSSEGTISSFSPISPLTPAENVIYRALPAPSSDVAPEGLYSTKVMSSEPQVMEEVESNQYQEYGRAASG